MNTDTFKDTLFERSAADFNSTALELFRHQAETCIPYKRFIEGLSVNPADIKRWQDIPHLPIEAFKNHEVKTGAFNPEAIYTSSGTTGSATSRHFVKHTAWYTRVFTEAFTLAYGSPSQFQWLCLLPSYLEREGSSLIDMAANFIETSEFEGSNFYLRNIDELRHQLEKAAQNKTPTVLLGVSFALLDFIDEAPIKLGENTLVMETGGMKGRRKEMIRAELHNELCEGFGVTEIHSEYGMTELMSQAYSNGHGLYSAPPWMRLQLRDTSDPLSKAKEGKTGGVNIIDLANVDSCAFLATQDLGRIHTDEGGNATFEILGRFDESDVRGCNLLVV